MFISITEKELDFLHLLRNISNSFLDFLFEAITFLGEQYVLIVIIAILYYTFNKKETEKLMYSVFVSMLVNGALKLFVQRPRPFSEVHQNPVNAARQETATGYSFPSGHSQNSAVIYSGSAIVIKKNWATIVACILIILIGFSRLWLGVHYPTDVLIGITLGIVCSFGGFYILNKYGTNKQNKYIIYGITALIFLPIIIYFYINLRKLTLQDPSTNYYRLYKDIFSSYGLFLGFFLAVFLENKYVNFTDTTNNKLKLYRVLGAILMIVLTYATFKILFNIISQSNVLLDMIRYFMVSFIGLGLYPILFKKILFNID